MAEALLAAAARKSWNTRATVFFSAAARSSLICFKSALISLISTADASCAHADWKKVQAKQITQLRKRILIGSKGGIGVTPIPMNHFSREVNPENRGVRDSLKSPSRALVPKLQLGNASVFEAPASRCYQRIARPIRVRDCEAGASGTAAFPSWSLGTRSRRLRRPHTPSSARQRFSDIHFSTQGTLSPLRAA